MNDQQRNVYQNRGGHSLENTYYHRRTAGRAQGGKAEDLKVCFDNGLGGIVNSSRGILTAYKKAYKGLSYVDGAVKAAEDMRRDLIGAVGVYKK